MLTAEPCPSQKHRLVEAPYSMLLKLKRAYKSPGDLTKMQILFQQVWGGLEILIFLQAPG